MSSQDLNNNSSEQLRRRYRRYYTWLGPLVNKPKNKAYTFLALSFFTVAFFAFFAIRPTVNTIIGLTRQIDDEKIVEKKLQDKINALSQLQAEYEIIQPDLPALNAALPVKANIVELVQSAESLARDNQASLSAVQLGETNLSSGKNITTPQIHAVPISFLFTTEGNYANLSAIIKKISLLPRLLSIQNVLMIQGLGKIINTVKVNAYYLPTR